MDSSFENLLQEWPLSVIRDVDITMVMIDSAPRRYAAVNRALKKGVLVRLRRGVYLIGKPFRKISPSNFRIAHSIYGPSYISFESALYYHQWIPEAVYTTTCATSKRAREFDTTLGLFQYVHVPDNLYYLGVQRVGSEDEAFFIADPWKALADHYYAYNRNWNRPEDLHLDMRIEIENMLESDLTMLQVLSEQYQSSKVRKFLSNILRGLVDGNKSN
ncbi:MAG: type IV toxin-antitoxin system AbiEi family antitoxin domain-containing protein [Parachlamydiaceae bacterium]|nr:type IV toxin-antitoxin system AbiEi family antitoxin domain-containing protein [Parachlamydiaceae bacterium]